MFENQLNRLRALQPLLEAVDSTGINALAKFLYDRICNLDSYLVFLGETSSGKSSIINGLIGEHILPESSIPTTAAITELELCKDINKNEYLAIDKDASYENISESDFKELCLNPTSNIARLKLRQKNSDSSKRLNHLRIFDTPGYGSIMQEHEEVLKDFLPNSDIVVYTVSYKRGILENDYAFLRFLKELVREDVKIILLINMCPPGTNIGDVRIKEIMEYVNSLLHIEPDVILQPFLASEDRINRPLVQCDALWESVEKIINSPQRVEYMGEVFDGYIWELYEECDAIIQNRYLAAKLSDEEYETFRKSQLEAGSNIRQAIDLYVRPTFDRIRKNLPGKMNSTEKQITSILHEEIEKSDKMKRDDTRNYLNAFYIPHTIDTVSKNTLLFYIEAELEDLNKKVDDYIQKEIVKLNTKIKTITESHVEKQTQNIMGGIIQRTGARGLGRYFAKFGGAGGANAGIANAASHYLKVIGKRFNKTFSKETHNALKHYMAKFGATSMKAVAVALVVFVEIAFAAYDIARFKSKFKKATDKSIAKWKDETLPLYLKDLDKLEDENIDTLRQIASEFENNIVSKPEDVDLERCFQHVLLSQQIRKDYLMK